MDQIYNNVASGIYDNRVLNKFIKLLPKKYNIFAYKKPDKNGESVIFYISENIIDTENFNTDDALGFISFYIDYIDNDMSVLFINTIDKFKGKGLGTFFMILAASYTNTLNVKCKCIPTIILDDDSDNSWNMKHNIYVKLGLKYINTKPEPEMKGELMDVVNYWNTFQKKYKNKLALL